jgi:hypothetical protein
MNMKRRGRLFTFCRNDSLHLENSFWVNVIGAIRYHTMLDS